MSIIDSYLQVGLPINARFLPTAVSVQKPPVAVCRYSVPIPQPQNPRPTPLWTLRMPIKRSQDTVESLSPDAHGPRPVSTSLHRSRWQRRGKKGAGSTIKKVLRRRKNGPRPRSSATSKRPRGLYGYREKRPAGTPYHYSGGVHSSKATSSLPLKNYKPLSPGHPVSSITCREA